MHEIDREGRPLEPAGDGGRRHEMPCGIHQARRREARQWQFEGRGKVCHRAIGDQEQQADDQCRWAGCGSDGPDGVMGVIGRMGLDRRPIRPIRPRTTIGPIRPIRPIGPMPTHNNPYGRMTPPAWSNVSGPAPSEPMDSLGGRR